MPVAAVAPTLESFDDAFEELYGRAYRTAFRLLGVREEAVDIAQETMARAFSHWRELVSAPHSQAWVARVAANLAVDFYRRRGVIERKGFVADDVIPEPLVPDRIDLLRALDRLTHRQRQVVLLRYAADLPEDTVASALGCSVGSVKTHASRGLDAMRSHLGARGRRL